MVITQGGAIIFPRDNLAILTGKKLAVSSIWIMSHFEVSDQDFPFHINSIVKDSEVGNNILGYKRWVEHFLHSEISRSVLM